MSRCSTAKPSCRAKKASEAFLASEAAAEEQTAGRDPVGQHDVNAAGQSHRCHRNEAEHAETEVAHGRIRDQALDIGLDDRDDCAVDDPDDCHPGEPRSQFHRRVGKVGDVGIGKPGGHFNFFRQRAQPRSQHHAHLGLQIALALDGLRRFFDFLSQGHWTSPVVLGAFDLKAYAVFWDKQQNFRE